MPKIVKLLLAVICTMWSCQAAYCWEVGYEGNALPSDPVLGSGAWQVYPDTDVSQTWSDGELLHLVDSRTDNIVYFSREGGKIPAGTSITLEAKVRIASGTPALGYYAPGLIGASTYSTSGAGGLASAWLWTDRITVWHRGGWFDYDADLTEFRTIRIALNEQNRFSVWLDGTQVFSGMASAQWQDGVVFGSSYDQATLDSQWDYVRYSKEFLPVPEPSSFLALGMGGIGMLGAALRRRRG